MPVADLSICALQPEEEVRQTLADVHVAEQQNLHLVVGTTCALHPVLVGTEANMLLGRPTCLVT